MITLYDFDGKVKGAPWNPNVWKTRYSLNYKGLPYKSVWIEYPDIEGISKKMGALPTGVKHDGSPLYTIPLIHDDATGVVIADSALIAGYLDKTYPHTPALFPPGTRALQSAFIELFYTKIMPLFIYTIPDVPEACLNPPSAAYFETHRSADFGVPALSFLRPSGPEQRAEAWKKVIEALASIDALMKENDTWVMGDVVSFADFVVGSALNTIRTNYGADSAEWKDLTSCHNGRWGRITENLKQYSQVL